MHAILIHVHADSNRHRGACPMPLWYRPRRNRPRLMVAKTKQCIDCEQVYPRKEPYFYFYAHVPGGRRYPSTRCRTCHGLYTSQRKAAAIEEKATRPRPDHCECCGKACVSNTVLCYDHDHTTDEFRGWLCAACNLGIGKLGDDVTGLQRAMDYLQRHYVTK